MRSEKHFNLIPSIGGSYSYGWSKMFGPAFLTLLIVVIISGLIQGPMAATKIELNGDDLSWPLFFILPLFLFGIAYAFLVVPVIKYGEDLIFVNAVRDQEVEIVTLFEGFRGKYINIILANLIKTALIGLGTIMFIIPGIIVACRLSMVSYLVMDKDLDAMKAIEKSWQITRGHGWKVFWMAVLSFFVYIAGFIVMFVGVIFSIMWVHAAFASLYVSLITDTDEENPIPILGVNEE